jgi:hypothetical protein
LYDGYTPYISNCGQDWYASATVLRWSALRDGSKSLVILAIAEAVAWMWKWARVGIVFIIVSLD